MFQRLYAFALALAVAGLFVSTTAAFPLCAIYTPDNPEYWVFFCWLDDKPTLEVAWVP